MQRAIRSMLSLAAALALGSASAAQADPDAPEVWTDGASPHCVWMILDAFDQVGEGCFPHQDAEMRAAAREGVGELERFLVAHSKHRPTAAELAQRRLRLRRENQAGGLCQGDVARLYRELRSRVTPADFRQGVRALTARPDKADEGDCF